jgi:uncharacterized protein YndB with AHSA1/START domain
MTKPETGRLWWIADDEAELAQIKFDLLTAGAIWIEEWRTDPPRIHYVFEIEKSRAFEILGYEPDEEEWLEPE